MRCPECTVRNSVAAVVCKDCGTKLPRRKGIPKDVLIGVGAVVLVGGVALAGLSALPALFDSEGNLQKLAKRVALGPKSPDEATRMKTDLESGIRSYLEHKLQVPSPELIAGLQKIFPSSAFEVHIADLPEGLRLVEVDTILQSSNFVLSPKHVAVLRDFDIYDTAVIVPDGAKKTMILLGHGNVQDGRKPQVRLFTVEADGLKEKSEKSVPPLTGEGSAVLQKNGRDIGLELSLASRATEEKLFLGGAYRAAGVADETVRPRLVYRDGVYELADDNGHSPLAALRAAAFLVADPSQRDRFRKYLAPSAHDKLNGLGQLKVFPPAFLIKRTGGGGGNPNYVIGNTDDAFEVALARDGGIYQVKSIRRAKPIPSPSETEVALTPPSYEGTTSTLVDKLLAAPDNHASPVTGTAAGTGTVGSAAPTVTAAPPASREKIVERAAGGERGSVSDKVDQATVKVRSGPSTSYKTVTEASRGSELEILGKQDGWYKVRFGDKEGYIYGAFVNCSTNDAYAVAVAKRHKSVKNENNITISHVETGDRVVVLDGNRNDKYKVQLSDGRVGYVYKEILDIEGGSRQLASAAPAGVVVVKPVTMPVQTAPVRQTQSHTQGHSQNQSQGQSGVSSSGSRRSSRDGSNSSSSNTSRSNSSNNSASRKSSDDSEQESRHSRRRHRHRHRHSRSGSGSSKNSPPPFVP